MQITIQKTQSIPPDILSQVKQFSPRDGLKSELGNPEVKDIRVQCAQENYAGYITNNGKLISFTVLAQDDKFNKNIAEILEIDSTKTAVMIYLFTVPEYQNKGYAKILVEALGNYAKENFPGLEALIRTTSSSENKKLYEYYGARLSDTSKTNAFIQDIGIENDYYFIYEVK